MDSDYNGFRGALPVAGTSHAPMHVHAHGRQGMSVPTGRGTGLPKNRYNQDGLLSRPDKWEEHPPFKGVLLMAKNPE